MTNSKFKWVHALFEHQASITPEATAVSLGSAQLTFATLNRRANQLAHRLQAEGVGPDQLVALCMDSSLEMIISLLAVLKAGGAYLPLDPAYPIERLAFMLADSQATLLLTQPHLAGHIPSTQVPAIYLDAACSAVANEESKNLVNAVTGQNLAYVIYTSGSTGQPKGVMIHHAGLANYLTWAINHYPAREGQGTPLHSSIGFDLTITALFPPLLTGKQVVLLPESAGGQALAQVLTSRADFSLVKITPAHLLLLNEQIRPEQTAVSTRAFVIGGEQLTAENVSFWRQHAPHIRLFNEYGPTETVVGCCVYELPADEPASGALPIGQPIANTQLYILNEQMEQLPVGVSGELYIGGAGVARGYLNRPELTAEKFVPDPFSQIPGSRLYRTGDLARLRPDGQYEFLGRLDNQVKIRGYRIELGEIEAVLGEHTAVQTAAVVPFNPTPDEKRLAAYIVPQKQAEPISLPQLRHFLQEKLPSYMIPASFTLLESLPLTPNGKVNRKALPAPETARPLLSAQFVAPRSDTETTIAQAWRDVMGIDPIGVQDSFFELGGDSISAIQIIARLRHAGLHLTQKELFNFPTVAALARQARPLSESDLSPGIEENQDVALSLRPWPELEASLAQRQQSWANVEAVYPLSPMQAGILFHYLLAPEADVYFEQPTFVLNGRLNPPLFQKAWQQLVDHHPILRTIFVWEQLEEPQQVVLRQADLGWEMLDWRSISTEEQATRRQTFFQENKARGFDLARERPFRLTLIQLADEQFQLVWSLHHLIIDGWSEGIFYRELFSRYTALLSGEQPQLEPALPFATYIQWQRSQDFAAAEQFWRARLSGFLAPTPLNVDRKRPLPPRYDEMRFQLPQTLNHTLQTFAQTNHLTPGTLLHAAWAILLARYSGEDEVLFGVTVSGRSPRLPGSETITGVLINTLPLRLQTPTDAPLLPWLHALQSEQLAIIDYDYTPLPLIQNWSDLPQDQPLFETLVVIENYPKNIARLGQPTLQIKDYFSEEITNYPLTVRILPDAAGITVALVYDSHRFDFATIERLVSHWQTVLHGLATRADALLGQLPLLTLAEQQQIAAWQAASATFPVSHCLHQQFEHQVAKTPDATAVTFGPKQLTYAQLNARANQLAHFLQQKGVQPDGLVALYLERSLEMVIAILGVLKAGGAYLPIDTAYPPERIAFILEDAKPVVLLTQENLVTDGKWQVADGRWQVEDDNLPLTTNHLPLTINLDAVWPTIATQPTTNPASAVQPHHRAYVIYTSGSTGKPKGVLVTHANVMRLFQATDHWYNFSADDVWTLFHSYAFDFSVWEIWGALLYGGRVVVVPYLTSRSPHDFYRLLVAEGVTVLNQTPSAFRQLIQAEGEVGQDFNLALRYVIFGGEALELNTLQPWFDRHGDQKPQLINMYGITETTVHVTYRPISNQDVFRAPGSVIGRQIPDLQIYILDQNQQPVPIGVPGEIYVGGAGVAAGYLNRPELTAQRFIPLSVISKNELNTEYWPLNTVYRTGNLARFLPDGDIEYLGRIDHQVKIRGFRIELGEIEAALGGHTAVHQALVLVHEENGSKRLVAYLVLSSQMALTSGEVRQYLKTRLPAYMIPATYITLPAFPLTANGKIDRRALPAPELAAPVQDKPYTAPRTPVEQELAALFAQLLGAPQAGIHDNFFDLGGDSILSLRLLAAAQKRGLTFSLAHLFQQPTVARLAPLVQTGQLREPEATQPFDLISAADRALLPASAEDAFPLTRLQAGMFFHGELNPETAVYHNVTNWLIQAAYDPAKWQTALQQLAARHPLLRASFDLTTYSQPLQIIHRQVEIDLSVTDWRHLSPAEQEAALAGWTETEQNRPFAWGQAPFLRFHLQRCTEGTFRLGLTEHHAILDGWSVAVMLTELVETYLALLDRATLAPAPPTAHFREFVRLEQTAQRSAAHRAFWTEQLAGSNFTRLPRWPQPHASPQPNMVTTGLVLPAETAENLHHLARQTAVPLKSVLLAAHLRLLSWLAGEDEVVTGLVTNGRPETADGDRVLGLFLNTIPLRLPLEGGRWLDLVQATFAAEQAALPHRRFPLPDIQQLQGGQPLFETVFNFIHMHIFHDVLNSSRFQLLKETFIGATNYPFSVEFEVDSLTSQIKLTLEYDTAQFGTAQIESIGRYYLNTLAEMGRHPTGRYERYDPLPSEEKAQLLDASHGRFQPIPQPRTLHERFTIQARQTPNALALTAKSGQFTYETIEMQANQLAHYLQRAGVGPEKLVAFCLERSPEAAVAILAILKAGGAFLPLDPTYPPDRLATMLADSQAGLLLTQSQLQSRLPKSTIPTIHLDNAWPAIIQENSSPPKTAVYPNNLAYVIYTSGSTGKPKGVQISHLAAVNHSTAVIDQYNLTAADRVLQFAALSFDVALEEMFPTWFSGGTVVLRPAAALDSLADFHQFIATARLTVLNLPASFWQAWLTHLEQNQATLPPTLRLVVTGSEALPVDAWQRWQARFGQSVRWLNAYGPTETTITSTLYEPAANENIAGSTMPIGRPLANMSAYVLNQFGQLCPTGTPGELFLGGPGVARGYLGHPALTAEKFPPDPFTSQPETAVRLYRTGDLARRLPDGNLEFLGRIDNQVKLRGFRVELGEIETCLGQHPAVQTAVVTLNDSGDQLIAYLATAAPSPETADLRRFLQARLPGYMIPAAYVLLDALPLLPNGKIDRKALPSPTDALETAVSHTPPRNATEVTLARIWAELLDRPAIGIDDNFFELGGHSLLAMQAIAQIQRQLAVELPLRTLFESPTIAQLSLEIVQREATQIDEALLSQLLAELDDS